MKGVAFWFSNSDMSYDTKAQKNRPEPLPGGVALSTLVFVEDDELDDTQPDLDALDDQPPSKSTANDRD